MPSKLSCPEDRSNQKLRTTSSRLQIVLHEVRVEYEIRSPRSPLQLIVAVRLDVCVQPHPALVPDVVHSFLLQDGPHFEFGDGARRAL